MKTTFAFLFLFLTLSYSVGAQPAEKLQLTDIYDLEYVSNPQISPDGKKIVYVRNFKDIMTDQNLSNLWMVNSDGTNNRPLTTGNHVAVQPVWSHDGSKLLFKSNMQDEKMKIFLMWVDSREMYPITQTTRAPSSYSWSWNDEKIAFNMFVPEEGAKLFSMPQKPAGAEWKADPKYIDEMNYRSDGAGYVKAGHSQLFIIDAEGGSPRQLTHSAFDHGTPVFSRDDSSLIFSANLHENQEMEPLNSELYTYDLSDGTITALTDRFGPDSDPAVSKSGAGIAYIGFDDRFQGHQQSELYVIQEESEPKLLTGDLDFSVSDPQWDEKGNGVYFQYTEKGETKVGYVSLNGKTRTLVGNLGGLSLGRPYNQGDYHVSENDVIAFTLGTPEHPADLAVWNRGDVKRITHLNKDLFSYRKLGQVQEIWWKSSYDQRDVQGWIITPPDFDPSKKYPMILEIHGGPFLSYGSVFSAELQLMAAKGYVVLYANPRGSTSYGEEFANLIHHDYPNHDYEDLMSGVDAVIGKGFVDPERLFVTGGSGGGVLTAWIVGKTDRFSGAVVAKPVINWYSFVLYADNPGFFYKYWFPSKPWEDPQHYMDRSPLSYVANVTTPTMLLTGEEDYRTPIAESEQFYAALKLEGVETAMVRIPGASHGIASKPSNLIAKVAAILAWFEKHDK
ncbi:S9 family peptidase [Robertkochia aurantiaca]|uniref:S9 family peptidase n=1 Tax=Robertkochia aurantiaca TaxID=2873700 RepID=UPI001CC9C78B|nr:S9 family peptidase [Robertkochia sp. 3YJGBD-33]